MRTIVLAVMVVQFALTHPVSAQNSPTPSPSPNRPIAATLPLFDKNNCADLDPAAQLFCADPELNDLSTKLNGAIQARLNRLSDRRLAIAENADWIRNRNSSCGILDTRNISSQDFKSVRQCLLTETSERIAILGDPNFDCLAADTAAGSLICSDAELAIADSEMNDRALALIGKLRDNDAKDALAEYGRWIRTRDRDCDLVGKENRPIEDIAPAAPCLAEFIRNKTADLVAAKGDPKRVFGLPAPVSPNADGVDLCVAQIEAANACGNFLSVSRIVQIDSEVLDRSASVLAEIEMLVLSPFAACSPVASGCTGTCWDIKSGNAVPASPRTRDSFRVARRMRIEKSFEFQKAANGGWRCGSAALAPIDLGVSARSFSP
jgi:uncharacterized protein YecT (DUF1311 family)